MALWTPKTSVSLTAGKPATTGIWNKIWDNTQYLYDLLFSHKHDGSDGTFNIPVGSNELRNGSFEQGTAGWTVTPYTGGIAEPNTSNSLSGATCLQFTSTALINGGGEAISNEYLPVTGGSAHSVSAAILAAAANLSAKIEILWYATSGGSPISASTVYTSNNVPTSLETVGGSAIAPTAARFKRIKVTGHLPGSVAPVTTGTIYVDGVRSNSRAEIDSAGDRYANVLSMNGANNTNYSYVEVANMKMVRAGVFRFVFDSAFVAGNYTGYSRVYRNGAAAGVVKSWNMSAAQTISDDVEFSAGDTAQVFCATSAGTMIPVNLRVGSATGELMAVNLPIGVRP